MGRRINASLVHENDVLCETDHNICAAPSRPLGMLGLIHMPSFVYGENNLVENDDLYFEKKKVYNHDWN